MLRRMLAAVMIMAGSPVAAQVTIRPEVMVGAFQPGFVGEADEDRYPLRTLRIGTLNLSSGQLILADPLILSDRDRPLDLDLPPGRYPVDLAVADTGKGGHRVALARLLLSDAPPVRWAMAVRKGEDVRTLKGDQVFAYGVDSGTGGFVDAGARDWLLAQAPEKAEALSEDWIARGGPWGRRLAFPTPSSWSRRLDPAGSP